jgi:hypothetical protein
MKFTKKIQSKNRRPSCHSERKGKKGEQRVGKTIEKQSFKNLTILL